MLQDSWCFYARSRDCGKKGLRQSLVVAINDGKGCLAELYFELSLWLWGVSLFPRMVYRLFAKFEGEKPLLPHEMWFFLENRVQGIGEQGGVRGCRPPPVSIFMTPPLKFKSTPPPREGLLDPLAGFWIFDRRAVFFRVFFWKFYLPKKNFRRLTPAKFFFLGNGQIMQF